MLQMFLQENFNKNGVESDFSGSRISSFVFGKRLRAISPARIRQAFG